MAHRNEIDTFRAVWKTEAQNTIRLLEALPADQYDFRPDPKGRSLGELAWHLSEIDGYISMGAAQGKIDFEAPVPDMKRPREVKLLAPGYRRVHEAAVARLEKLKNEDLDRAIPFMGRQMTIREVLWGVLLHHMIHHRGQLALMCRLAGGRPAAIYGPIREEMMALQGGKA
jgi:uncharacterized damage-inducible protein DinB